MDEQQYTYLIRRLELDSHAEPAAFRRRVMLVSVGAYAAVCGTVVLAVLLVGAAIWLAITAHLGIVAVKLAFVAMLPLVAMLAVLRVFFRRIPAPEGRRLERHEAPALFDMLDRMRKKLNGPRIDHVLVDDRYNAAIAQCPRFGLVGWHVNYLILGLPYMLGTPTKEMLATIAHEYGHLCGSHGKLGAWVYRQRRVFGALSEQIHAMAEDSVVHRLLARVLDLVMPRYNAYTFVMSRQNEYDADRTATELVGAVSNAQGLVRDTLQGRWMHEHFWPTLFRHAELAPQPPFMPYAAMKTAFRAGYVQWAQPELLAAALAQRSDVHDTHPCLRERLEATGETPALPRPLERAAAETLLLPDTQRALVREFDEAWWTRTSRDWTAYHRRAETSRTRMVELGGPAAGATEAGGRAGAGLAEGGIRNG